MTRLVLWLGGLVERAGGRWVPGGRLGAVSCGLACCLGSASAQTNLTFYVSPTGSDTSAGTAQAPFATLEQARDTIRAARAGQVSNSLATIQVQNGTYYRTQTFELTSADANLNILAEPTASPRLRGGARLEAAWFSLVDSNSPVWRRLDASAQGVVLQADLGAHSITNLGALRLRGMSGLSGSDPGPFTAELFCNDLPLELARWPNAGSWATVAGTTATNVFTYSGSRPNRWLNAPDPWYHGYWYYLWADFTLPGTAINTNTSLITMAQAPRSYGIRSGQPWFAFNLLEEIDIPGEYYIDRGNQMLYLWPPANFAAADLFLSQLDSPLISVQGATNIVMDGLELTGGRGDLLSIDSVCLNVEFRNGRLLGAGRRGATLDGVSNRVTACEIALSGDHGVALAGGNRLTLVAGGNAVRDCRIHDFGRLSFTYTPAVLLSGDGQSVLHNEIFSAPHAAILFTGNEHQIAFNEIYRVCLWTSDAGAIYSGRDWGYRGNRIQDNFIHDIASGFSGLGVHAVYLDDCVSGIEVSSNVVYRVQNYALFNGGGRDNLWLNNVVARCGTFHYGDSRGTTSIVNTPGSSWNLLERIEAMNYQQPTWSNAYPALAAIPDNYNLLSPYKTPGGTVFSRNVGWTNTTAFTQSGSAFSYYAQWTNNITNSNPLFVDEANLDLTLQSNSPAFTLPGFGAIPFLAIGVGLPRLTNEQAVPAPPGFAAAQAWIDPKLDSNCVVQICYGATDCGRAVSNWDHAIATNVSVRGIASFQVPLGSAQFFYGRFRAANNEGETWSQTAFVFPLSNLPPVFVSNPFTNPAATASHPYSGSIAASATDPNLGDTLTFHKLAGPAWLSVATGGSLSGTPAEADAGLNSFTVSATDAGGLSASATMLLIVNVLPVGDLLKANNTTNLNLASSWVWGVPPVATNVAVWDSTVTGANTVSLGGNLSWGGIRITNVGGAVTVNSGNTLSLGAAGLDLGEASQNLTLNCALALTAPQEWTTGSGRTLTLGGTVTNGGNLLTISGAGNSVLNGKITGSSGLTKNDAGQMQLLGTSDFTGPVVCNGGQTVIVGSGLGSASMVTLNAGAQLVASTATSVSRPVTLNGGNLRNWLNNATFSFTGGITLAGPGTFTFKYLDNRCILSVTTAKITGNYGISVIQENNSGTATVGVLQLGADGNDYAGDTIMRGGTLKITTPAGSTNALPNGPGKGNLILDGASFTAAFDLNGHSEMINGLLGTNGPAAPTVFNNGGGSVILTVGDGDATGAFPGALADHTAGTGTLALAKVGLGRQNLSGTNTYSGPTLVSAGALLVNGQLSTNAVTIASGGTLGGSGLIRGPVIVQSGGSLAPSTPGPQPSSLTVSNSVTFQGGAFAVMVLDKSLSPSNDLLAASSIAFNGSLLVTNLGPALAAGDRFQLFSTAAPSGSFANFVFPALAPGLAWTNQLAVNGSIAVCATVPVTPTHIRFSLAADATQAHLFWPSNYIGWLVESNAVSVADTNFWFAVPGAEATNELFLNIDQARTNVFYRMLHP
jgi:autotransporter-associated beta strand protein